MKYIQLATGKNAFDASKVDIRIMGNTYDVKDQLKAMGAEYDGENREWTITVDKDIHAIGRVNKMFKDANFGADMTVRLITKAQAIASVQ